VTRDDLERFLARRERAWFDRDASALAADYAETCLVESPTHGPQTTRDAVRQVFATWFDAFPDLKFMREDVLADGDRVALCFKSTGTHMKPFGVVPASGRAVEIRGVFVITFRDGQIVHERRYYDATSLLVQIGVLKAKPV
jgi:steroid delta-isomerase-like uncharacterized protein